MRGLTVACGIAFLLGGCAFQKQVHNIAVDYNEAVASTSNELTFLNIVRAKERHPLHFTTISAMRGGISMNLASNLSVGFRGEALTSNFDAAGNPTSSQTQRGVDAPTPGISGSITTGPSFDVGILNTQDFQRGILQPVSTQVVVHFLQQGWPADFLTALFVERIELVLAKAEGNLPKGHIVRTIFNDPHKPIQSAEFVSFLRCFVLTAASTSRKEQFLASYEDLRAGSTLSDIALLDGNKFDLSETEDPTTKKKQRAVVRVTPSSAALALRSAGAPKSCDLGDPGAPSTQLRFTDSAAASDALQITLRQEAGRDQRGDVTLLDGAMTLETTAGASRSVHQVETRVVIRSPSAIIYFLGEYARNSEPYAVEGGHLMVIREGGSGNAFVRTRLAGRTYHIPARDNGRSLQTLSIVQQLVNLHKNSADLPSTGAVQIVR